MARIWTGGCIIRARLLEDVMRAFARRPDLTNLLFDEDVRRAVLDGQGAAARARRRRAARAACRCRRSGATLAYFDSYRTAELPQNLTQAQRDAFGAHTYQRNDAGRTRRSCTPSGSSS